MSTAFKLKLILVLALMYIITNAFEILIITASILIILLSLNGDSYFYGARIPAKHKAEFYKHIK